MRNIYTLSIILVGSFIFSAACQIKHEVAPLEVKPIHITIDVNVQIKKELDDFFDDVYGQEENQKESISE